MRDFKVPILCPNCNSMFFYPLDPLFWEKLMLEATRGGVKEDVIITIRLHANEA